MEPSTHWIGGWACCSAGVDAAMKRKPLPHPCWVSNPHHPSHSLIA